VSRQAPQHDRRQDVQHQDAAMNHASPLSNAARHGVTLCTARHGVTHCSLSFVRFVLFGERRIVACVFSLAAVRENTRPGRDQNAEQDPGKRMRLEMQPEEEVDFHAQHINNGTPGLTATEPR